MASYRNISINFWTDSKVDDEFTPEDKYFYLYLLTNPHTSLCGCYEISMKQMERETGYNADTIKRLIERMEKTHRVIRFSADTKEILILNWYKFNWSKSEKVRSAIATAIEYIKNESFKRYVIDMVYIVYQYRINTILIPNPPDTDTDTVSDADAEEEKSDTVSIGYKYPTDTVSDAPHTSSLIDQLIFDYGKDAVDNYIQRVKDWHTKHHKKLEETEFEETVARWMREDNVTKIDHDVDKYKVLINNF